MFINPRKAIENGWITGIVDESKQVQPNAIDFTIDRVFSIDADDVSILGNAAKVMRSGSEVYAAANEQHNGEYFYLDSQTPYDCLSNVYVDLPEGVAAQLVIRSSLSRNGLTLSSGLYDSGYKGNIGWALHNNLGPTMLEKGSRVGQIIFVTSDNADMYAGGWNHADGTHWSDSSNGKQQ